jgi:hypothetical protein
MTTANREVRSVREERGQLTGNQIISEPVDFWGKVDGDVHVVEGGKFYLRGAIYGSLYIEDGGRVHLFGNLMGNLYVAENGKAIISGVVGGDCHNDGGRMYIDSNAKILGKVKKHAGETQIDSKAKIGK